ncbi:SCP-like protein [Ancylostoma caninum]|uniref:SCP-like protein n=1 Tax=Ancylostoma caninum TaxID=29170 RepID=A0A368FEY7_ANCCA|nr:SCP-like protein [Ancylostoma caninum]
MCTNAVAWDCNLEKEAQENAEKCTAYAGTYGANEQMFKGKPCNATSKTKEVLNTWWKEIRSATLPGDNKYDKTMIPHFGQMAFHESTIMACSYAACSGQTNLLCLYEKPAVDQQELYAAGDTCGDCADKCIDNLCQPAVVNHIADKTTCADGKLSDELTEAAVNMHNYYRGVIASGWAKDPKSMYAPRASKMNKLAYECNNYAKDAAEKLDNCEYPVPAPTKGVQNTHKFDNNWTISHGDALEQAISAWYGELEKSGGIGDDPTYKDDMQTNGLGNYVNLANEANTVVGCAAKTCQAKGYTLVACQYDSTLTADDPIYTTGKPCSKCSTNNVNKNCETENPKALCVA